MGDGATSGNSAALKQNSSPVPNNVNHESSKGDSSSSVKKHHSISSSLKDFSSPSVKKEHSSSTSKSHLKENSHSTKSHHKHSTGEHKHSSKHKSSSSDHSKHGEHKHHSSSSSHKQRDSSARKSKDGSRHPSSNKSNSSSKEHSSSSKTKSKEKRHSENDVKKENGIDVLPVKSLSESYIKTEPAMSPLKVKSESLSPLKITFKKEKTEYSDDDVPLERRINATTVKRPVDSDDDVPLTDRAAKIGKFDTSGVKFEKAVKKESVQKKRKHDEDDYNATQVNKKKKKLAALKTEKVKTAKSNAQIKKEKQEAEEKEKWRWWEEDRKDDGTKWKFLEHSGPMFAPPYEPLPDDVKFYYDGKEMKLSLGAEEVATFYARMIEHDYTTRDIFNRNFMKDWRKTMTFEEKQLITDLKKCDFRKIHVYFTRLTEERKNRTKEEKLLQKKENERLVELYGYSKIDGHTEKIGNFRIEPPGLFRGRGDHPKQGMLKKRTMPEDVIINCSKDAQVPSPPEGHKWKEVRHDNTVSWLACWVENIQASTKYVMLNAASKLKGEKDWQKYETARNLHRHVDRIRAQYREDWKSKEMRIRQRAVALYFIDKLALRAGNEKDEDQADTVGCCSLRVEHIKLHEKLDDKEFVVEFDFLGKDSIRYYNKVSVEKRVFKNLLLFTDNKQGSDDVFRQTQYGHIE
ncbi:DNA topoisomerase 1 [Lamellibrachia satsuma]|nr:DNA topoisomerase 1 [Lamellibrachia satsuma]